MNVNLIFVPIVIVMAITVLKKATMEPVCDSYSPAPKRKKGFSLVEFMGVMMIMIILGGSGFVIVGHMSDKAKFARANSDIGNIREALVTYYDRVGSYDDIKAGDNSLATAFGDKTGTPYKVFSGSFNVEVDTWKDPWGGDYYIKKDFSATKKVIIVYVKPDSTKEIESTTFGGYSGIAKDSYSGKPMAQFVYNIQM